MALYVADRESEFRPKAYNGYSGASGIFQHLRRYWPGRADVVRLRRLVGLQRSGQHHGDHAHGSSRGQLERLGVLTHDAVRRRSDRPGGAASSPRPRTSSSEVATTVAPGVLPVRHDAHRREPLPHEADQLGVVTERHEHVRSLGVDLVEGRSKLDGTRGELPLGRDHRLLERGQRPGDRRRHRARRARGTRLQPVPSLEHQVQHRPDAPSIMPIAIG